MLGLIAQGVGFGFAAGTSPGPLQTFIISTTLSRGWRRGIVVIFAPLVSDAPIILLMTLLLRQLPEGVIRGIQIAGGLFVLWLAWGTWVALRAGLLIGAEGTSTPGTLRRTLLQAAGINALSPGPYLFWGTVTGPILVQGLATSFAHGAAFLMGFYVMFLAVMAGLVLVFDRLRRLDERLTRGALMLTIGVLAVLGAVLLAQGILG